MWAEILGVVDLDLRMWSWDITVSGSGSQVVGIWDLGEWARGPGPEVSYRGSWFSQIHFPTSLSHLSPCQLPSDPLNPLRSLFPFNLPQIPQSPSTPRIHIQVQSVQRGCLVRLKHSPRTPFWNLGSAFTWASPCWYRSGLWSLSHSTRWGVCGESSSRDPSGW